MKRYGSNARTSTILIIFFTAILLPVSALATSTYLITGFVPELATPTVEGYYSYHSDHIDDNDLDRTVLGFRFAYVPYPALESNLDLKFLSYDFEGNNETGLGLGLGIKYQLAQLSENFDMAIALLASLGSAENVNEFDGTVMGFISRDIPQGWTPFGGIGISYVRQEHEGREGLHYVKETSIEPVIAMGLKYMFQNRLSISVESFIQDGIGLETGVGFRF